MNTAVEGAHQDTNRRWDRRVGSWHHQVHASAGFARVRDAVLAEAKPLPTDRCADLGAGTGFLTFPLAERSARVLAVDASAGMTSTIRSTVPAAVADRVDTLVADLAVLDLPAASLDLIVSSYTLHHLHHSAKRELMVRAAGWLAPGGRIVIADMMFGRGGSEGDRAILAQKIKVLAAKGPGGWLRIAKNAARFGLGVGSERPAAPEFWQQAMRDAGLVDVRYERIVAEAGLVSARRSG